MKRGRKSTAEVASIIPIGALRPAPPDDLSADQADVWRETVLRLPADWFPRETHSLLAEYCKATVRARFVGVELDRFEAEWLKEDGGVERYARLVAAVDRQVRSMTALARALRITNQSRLRAETAARRAAAHGGDVRRPWEGMTG